MEESKKDTRKLRKYRTCLKCGEKFLSFYCGNRICFDCSIKNSRVSSRVDNTIPLSELYEEYKHEIREIGFG